MDQRFIDAWTVMNERVNDFKQTLSYRLAQEVQDDSLTAFAMQQSTAI